MIKIQCTDTQIEIDSNRSKLISNILADENENENEIVPVPYYSTLVYSAFDENIDLDQKETLEISKILECANFLDISSTFNKICRYIAYKIKNKNNELINLVLNNLDKPWDWDLVSRNPGITMQNILDNPDKPWKWYYVSQNSDVTTQFILDNPDKPWNWYGISENPNITMQFILNHPDKP
jgi:hypothetical protein